MSRLVEITKDGNNYSVNPNASPSVSKTLYCYKSEDDSIIQIGNGCYSFYSPELITETGEYFVIYGACWGGSEEPWTESGSWSFTVNGDVITVTDYDDVTIVRDSSNDIVI